MSTALEARAENLTLNTSVSKKNRKELASILGKALASTYVLYHKTHGYHWNVTGPLFYSIHKLTDEQYNDLAQAVDDIAERIRGLSSIWVPAIGEGSSPGRAPSPTCLSRQCRSSEEVANSFWAHG